MKPAVGHRFVGQRRIARPPSTSHPKSPTKLDSEDRLSDKRHEARQERDRYRDGFASLGESYE